MLPTTENEENSLPMHVKLCELRYASLDERLTRLEGKLDEIDKKIDGFKKEIGGMIIRGGIALIVFLSGALATTLKLLGHF